MAVKMTKEGYAQLEPNRLSAQRTKEVYGQLPLDSTITVCEQGMCLVYDEVQGKVVLPAKEGDYACLVFNEFVLEDPRKPLDRDYAMLTFGGSQYEVSVYPCPRLYGLTVGDTFTTNAVELATAAAAVKAGDFFTTGTNGYWVPIADPANAQVVLQVVKDFTMPDGQRGIKFVVAKVAKAVAKAAGAGA